MNFLEEKIFQLVDKKAIKTDFKQKKIINKTTYALYLVTLEDNETIDIILMSSDTAGMLVFVANSEIYKIFDQLPDEVKTLPRKSD